MPSFSLLEVQFQFEGDLQTANAGHFPPLQSSQPESLGGCLCWCPVTNLIAFSPGGRPLGLIGATNGAPRAYTAGLAANARGAPPSRAIALFLPSQPSEHTLLHVPTAAPRASLLTLQWSPHHTRRALLSVDRLGRGHVWTQGKGKHEEGADVMAPQVTNSWRVEYSWDLPDTLAARWLPGCLEDGVVWPPQPRAPPSSVTTGSVVTRFSGHRTQAGAWNYPDLLLIAAVTFTGKLQLHWSQFPMPAPHWSASAVASLGLPAPLLAADVSPRPDGTMIVAAVTATRPGCVHLVQVHALVPDGRRGGGQVGAEDGRVGQLRPGLDAGVLRVCELFGVHRLPIYAAYREPVVPRSAHIQAVGNARAGAPLAATWGVVASAAASAEEDRRAVSGAVAVAGPGSQELPTHAAAVQPPAQLGAADASTSVADGSDGARYWRHAGLTGESYRGGVPALATSLRAAASSGARPVELICEACADWPTCPCPTWPDSARSAPMVRTAVAAQQAAALEGREAAGEVAHTVSAERDAPRGGVQGGTAVPGVAQHVVAVKLWGGGDKELSVVTVTVGGAWQHQQQVYTAERWLLRDEVSPLWEGFVAAPVSGADASDLSRAPASELAVVDASRKGTVTSPGDQDSAASTRQGARGSPCRLTKAVCVAREVLSVGQHAEGQAAILRSSGPAAGIGVPVASMGPSMGGLTAPGGGAPLPGSPCVVTPSSDGTVLAIACVEGLVWCVDSSSLSLKYALRPASGTTPVGAQRMLAVKSPWHEHTVRDGTASPWKPPETPPLLSFSPSGCCVAACPPLEREGGERNAGPYGSSAVTAAISKQRVQVLVVEHVPHTATVPPSGGSAGGSVPDGDTAMLTSKAELATVPSASTARPLATVTGDERDGEGCTALLNAPQGPRRVKAPPWLSRTSTMDVAGWAGGVADRIWWSVLSERHPWDAIQVALAEQLARRELAPHVLRTLDDDFHALPPTLDDEQRLHYSHVLDKIKSELLRDYARFHTGATAVLEDMQARLVLAYVTSMFRAAMLHPPSAPAGMPLGGRYDHLYEAQAGDLEVEPSLLPTLEPWVQLLVDLAFLFVDDVKRFFTVLHRSGSRGVAAASQDYGTIPAVWLMRDRMFLGALCEQLLVATAVMRKRAPGGGLAAAGGGPPGAAGLPAVSMALAGRGPTGAPQFAAGGTPGGMMSSGGGAYTLEEVRILHGVICELHKGACSQPALPANAPLLPTHMHVGGGAGGSSGGQAAAGAATPPIEPVTAVSIPASPCDVRSPALPPMTPGDLMGDGSCPPVPSTPPLPVAAGLGTGGGGSQGSPAVDVTGTPGSVAKPSLALGSSGAMSPYKPPVVCLHYPDGARMPEWGRLTRAINSSPLQYLLRRTRAGPGGAMQAPQQVVGAQVPPLAGAAAQRGVLAVGTGAAAAALLHLGSERHVVPGLPSGLHADQRALQWSLGHILERCGSVMRQGVRKRRHADGEGALQMAACPWSKPCRGWWDILTGEFRSATQPRWMECVQCSRRTSAMLPHDQGDPAGALKAAPSGDASAGASQGGVRVTEASSKAWLTRWTRACPVCGGAWKLEKTLLV